MSGQVKYFGIATVTITIKNICAYQFVPAEYLIPLKAVAWLDLSQRKAEGQDVDSADIRKHKIDVFKLYQLLTPNCYHAARINS